MKTLSLTRRGKIVAALVAALTVLSSPAYAQTAAYNSNGTSIPGGNIASLNIGRTFIVSGNGINVSALGFFDFGSNGLVDSHAVTLFANNGASVLASVNVASGTSAQLVGGFRYVDLTAPLFLTAGNYSIIGYGFGFNRDNYADGGGRPVGGATNVTDGGFDPYQFTSAASPAYPVGGDSGNHSSASFLFAAAPVPEPATWAMMTLGFGAMGFAMRRKNVATRIRFA